MFYPEKIKSIQKTDRVLEVGPGSSPFHRSDEFLELKYETETEKQNQFGHTGEFKTSKIIHFYDGKKFPFKDLEFDYVICSHVLEHVEDVSLFVNELQRIAKKGYIEYPNINYDYLFNFNVHLNFLKKNKDTIIWMKKKDTTLELFKDVQTVFYDLLNKGQFQVLIKSNPNHFFEGFEWENKINVVKANSVSEIIPNKIKNKSFSLTKYIEKESSFKDLVKVLIKKITTKFK